MGRFHHGNVTNIDQCAAWAAWPGVIPENPIRAEEVISFTAYGGMTLKLLVERKKRGKRENSN